MSVFSDVPSPFPLNVSLKQRPVTFRLECDGAERIATLILSAMWGFGIPSVLLWLADPFAPWPDTTWPVVRIAALASLALFLAFGVRSWLWPNIRAALTRVDVRMTEHDIEVFERGPFGKRRWSKPISEYLGVAIENWGTRTIGNHKLPLAAVMLVHRDERFSLPIHIDSALRCKDRVAKGKADLLGLQLIDAPRFGLRTTAHAPGTIVMNHGQAWKVRTVYAMLGLAGLCAAVASFAGFASTGNVLYIALALSGLGLAAAIHLYASCYVTRMRRIGGDLQITTAVPLMGRHLIACEHVREIAYREGRGGEGTSMRTHTPWVRIRLGGSRLPFIVDMQSDFIDEAALLDLQAKAVGR